jgi:hypothetical protein
MADDSVTQFQQIAMSLVEAAIAYAKGGVFDEETDAAIRQVRVITNVLQAALQQAQISRPFMPPPSE